MNNTTLHDKYLWKNPDSFKFRNKVIAIEGMDGSGKTILSKQLPILIHAATGDVGFKIYRQPGGTPLGEKIRALIKEAGPDIKPRTEHLLMEASRIEVLQEVEKTKGKTWAILDRHSDSSWAYQSTRGVVHGQIYYTQLSYNDLVKPDVTIFLDVEPEVALERIQSHKPSGAQEFFDGASLEFFKEIRANFHMRVRGDRDNYLMVDANQPEHDVLSFVAKSLNFKNQE